MYVMHVFMYALKYIRTCISSSYVHTCMHMYRLYIRNAKLIGIYANMFRHVCIMYVDVTIRITSSAVPSTIPSQLPPGKMCIVICVFCIAQIYQWKISIRNKYRCSTIFKLGTM